MFIFCTYITINNKWENLFKYPEDVYQSLEADVPNAIQNFESDYNLTITHYDNQTNYLALKLSSDSSSLTIYVYNYKQNNQEIETKRDKNYPFQILLVNIFSLFILSLLLSLIEILIILLISFIILLIFRIISNKI